MVLGIVEGGTFSALHVADYGFDLNNREIAAVAYITAFLIWAVAVAR